MTDESHDASLLARSKASRFHNTDDEFQAAGADVSSASVAVVENSCPPPAAAHPLTGKAIGQWWPATAATDYSEELMDTCELVAHAPAARGEVDNTRQLRADGPIFRCGSDPYSQVPPRKCLEVVERKCSPYGISPCQPRFSTKHWCWRRFPAKQWC